MINSSIAIGSKCAQYSVSDFGAGLDLTRNGLSARRIVLKEAGTLRAVEDDGSEIVLTGLPQWYVHDSATRAILPGQQAALIVYW
jgi:hypothetical protein